MVTLRGHRMYEFFDRLVNVALPRVRDFKGVSDRAFDGRGNYALGVREQMIFPEIDFDKIDKGPRHDGVHQHDGANRRRGQSAAQAPGHAVPGLGDHVAKTCFRIKADGRRSSRCARTTAARCVAGRARISPLPDVPPRACADLARKGEIPGLTKASW